MGVLRMNFKSKALGRSTDITVCIPTLNPADFQAGKDYVPGMKYQVLYILHGGTGDDLDYLINTNIVQLAEKHKLAVIMPSGYDSCYTDDDNGPQYYTFISEELPKMCEALFPLSTNREDTFIAGHSMGSHGAMKVAIHHPEKFSAALLMSGASYRPGVEDAVITEKGEYRFDIKMPLPKGSGLSGRIHDPDYIRGTVNDVYSVAKKNAEMGIPLPKLLFSVGDCDHALYRTRKAEKDLREWGYETVLDVVPDVGHDWELWAPALEKALDEWLPLKNEAIYPDR